MKSNWCVLLLVLGSIVLAGCGGSRLTSLLDDDTAEGSVTLGGSLVRSYSDMGLRAGYEAIQKFAKAEGWTITSKTAKPRVASIEGKMKDGQEYELSVWTPKKKPTEVGITIKPEDIFKSADILDRLEKILPGKRIKEEPKNKKSKEETKEETKEEK